MILSVTPYFWMDDPLETLETLSSRIVFCSIAPGLPLYFFLFFALFFLEISMPPFAKGILGKLLEGGCMSGVFIWKDNISG
jgi:hypothetical protein